jgi:fumarate reductase flavoprotein subunit
MAIPDPAYDVVVIGAGGAGMSAALEAAAAGANVALLEAGARVGGSTALAGGLFFAAGTAQQRARGIDDNPDALYADIMAINGKTVNPEAVHRLCHEAPAALEWLMSLGVDFPPERLSTPNGRGTPRAHEPIGFGARIAECLDAALNRAGVDIACKSRAEHLITDGKGAVHGVLVGGEAIGSRAVVITTGGYGASPEWVTRLLPKTARVGDWVWHVGNATNRGDGLTMAEEAGAPITGEDSGLLLITPNFAKDFEVIGPDWALMVNSRGERFATEDGAYWEVAEAIEAQADARAFFIFDRRRFEEAKPHPRVLEALAAGTITVSWIPRVFEEQLKLGHVHTSPTLAGLAEKIGADPRTLESTVKSYTEAAKRGEDSRFGKAPASLKPVEASPFYAIEVRPAILTVTGGGMPIDADARVLARKGGTIPGLYAAGETVGNVYGRYYVGSGYAIASSITFGRIAGRSAAAYARQQAG